MVSDQTVKVVKVFHHKTKCNICMYVYMYVCMYVCMYVGTYVRTYVRTHARTHARTHVCMYVCMYACMYVRMYILYVYVVIHLHMQYIYLRIYISWLCNNCANYFCSNITSLTKTYSNLKQAEGNDIPKYSGDFCFSK